jgi:hypothetical protein
MYTHLIKMQRVNIGMTENPKFAQIGDYRSDETVEKISYLLCEYQDLFQTTFSEMKGIIGDLGECYEENLSMARVNHNRRK